MNVRARLLVSAGLAVAGLVAPTAAGKVEVDERTGVVEAGSPLPEHEIRDRRVFLRIPHLRQEPDLCVPTAAAMVLAYYGDPRSPRELKVRSRGRDYDPDAPFDDFTITWWRDLVAGMRSLGYAWREEGFATTNRGFARGMEAIRSSLRRGDPVLIDVALYRSHTFVVAGFDEEKGRVLIMDPNLAEPGVRILTYEQLAAIWNGRSYGVEARPALFTGRSREVGSGIE